MTLQEVCDMYRGCVSDASQMINSSPFCKRMNQTEDERYYRYQALSNALVVFNRYTRKATILKWLRSQQQTYQQTDGKPNEISAKAIAELIADVEEAS